MQIHVKDMRSEVLVAIKMSVLAFCMLRPCALVGRHQHFRGTYYLHLQGNPNSITAIRLNINK
jgi:hypothetical protein